jgi:hypothetical protein
VMCRPPNPTSPAALLGLGGRLIRLNSRSSELGERDCSQRSHLTGPGKKNPGGEWRRGASSSRRQSVGRQGTRGARKTSCPLPVFRCPEILVSWATRTGTIRSLPGRPDDDEPPRGGQQLGLPASRLEIIKPVG